MKSDELSLNVAVVNFWIKHEEETVVSEPRSG